MCPLSDPLEARSAPVSLVALATGLTALASLVAGPGVGLPAGTVRAQALVRDVCRLCRLGLALAQLEPASHRFLGSRRTFAVLAKLEPLSGRLFASRRLLPQLASLLRLVCQLLDHWA